MQYSNSHNQISSIKKLVTNDCNIIFFICLLLISLTTKAYSRNLIFIDQNRKPIEGVVASVVADRDSTLMLVEVTDKTGCIMLPDSILHNSILTTNYPGLQAMTLRPAEYGDSIILQPLTTELNEIVVTGKDIVKAEAGKILFTPGDLRNRVINAYDLLVNAPLLSEENSNLMILNKAAHILINGKEPRVPQEQVILELRNLKPGMVKKVEVVPFPDSSYSASGNFGLVNVIIKDRGNGIWVALGLNTTVGDHRDSSSESVSLYATNNRLKLSASGRFSYYNSGTKTDEQFLYNPDTTEEISIFNKSKGSNRTYRPSGDLYLSYNLTPKSIIGGGLSILTDKNTRNYSATSITIQPNGMTETSLSQTTFIQPWSNPQTFYQLFYTLDIDSKGSQLEISGIYRHDSSKSSTTYNFAPDLDEKRDEQGHGAAATAKYTQIFNTRQSLLCGYQFQTTNQKDASNSELQTYQFNYNETIHAAYATLQSKWSEVLSSSIGLRMENSRISGDMIGGDTFFKRTETDLFPSLTLNISFPNTTHFLILNLERRIYRPQFYDLTPYILWTSPNTCNVGNPDLKANKYWNISALYMFHESYTLNLRYQRNWDSNNPFTYGIDGISFTTRVNRPRLDSYGFAFEYNKALSKKWLLRLKLDASYNYSPFVFNGIDLTENMWSSWLTIRNRLTFPGKYTPIINLNVQVGYDSQMYGYGAHWLTNINVGASKEVLKNFQISAGLSSNIGSLWNARYSSAYYKTIKRSTQIPLTGSISMSYTFGNQKIRYFEDKTDTSYNSRF